MSIKEESELEGILKIGRIVALIRDTLKERSLPGVSTLELDRLAAELFESHSARSAPKKEYDFPGWTCLSVNHEVAHGIPGPRILREGDLINIDVSGELGGFYADTGVSFVVGEGPHPLRHLCDTSREALMSGLSAARTGRRLSGIGKAIHKRARQEGFTVIRNLAGHGIGRKLHEPPEILNYEDKSQRSLLNEGLVLAVESFVSTGAEFVVQDRDGWTLRTADGSFVAQHEHTVVVTASGPILATA